MSPWSSDYIIIFKYPIFSRALLKDLKRRVASTILPFCQNLSRAQAKGAKGPVPIWQKREAKDI